jgi:RNA polymerase sigma factor (sigma-70 family)
MGDDEVDFALSRLAVERGDERSWTILYLRFRPFIYAIAFRHSGASREFANEVVQEAFLRLVQYCPFKKLTTTQGFRSYLAVVTRNVMAGLRRRKRSTPTQDLHSEDNAIDLSEPVMGTLGETIELRQLLEIALDKLPARERRLIALSLEGYSLREVSDRLGISAGHAAVRLHRARTKLRRNPALRAIL